MAALLGTLLVAAVFGTVSSFPGCPGNSWEVKEHAGTCNYFPTLSLKFEAARNHCRDNYGPDATLPTVLNKQDNDFYSKHTAGRGWIGLVKDNPDGPWRWLDGSAYKYNNWGNGTGQPDMTNNCTTIMDRLNIKKGLWETAPCDRGQRVICKSGKVSNWLTYKDYEYFAAFSSGRVTAWNITWSDARRECMKKGGDLLSIEHHEEWKQVNKWVKERRPDWGEKYLWIGMHSDNGQSWAWSDSKRVQGLVYWNESYPISMFTGARCVYQNREGTWMNGNCGIRQNGYICKRREGSDNPITEPPPTVVQGFCPSGYYRVGMRCFRPVTDDSLTWQEAVKACRKEPGLSPDLASIHSKLESVQLTSHLGLEGPDLWLGGARMAPDGRLGWSDASPAGDYTHFNTTKVQGDCVSVGAQDVQLGRWTLDNCNKKKGYVCQTNRDPDNVIVTPAPQPVICPDHFTVYDQHCYRLIDQMVNWTQAYAICKNNFASLVTIENEAEHNAIFAEVLKLQESTKMHNVSLWMGLQDLENTGKYTWIDGNPANFTMWRPNEPKRKANGGCVAIQEGSLNDAGGEWMDKACSKLYRTVCRRPKVGGQTSAAPTTSKFMGPVTLTGLLLLLLFRMM